MSEGNVKVRLKIGVNEVEIEGSTADLKKTIELIPTIMEILPDDKIEQSVQSTLSRLSNQYSQLERFTPPLRGGSISNISVFPEIAVEKGDSLSDIITKLFTNGWGRRPHKLGDVREALQSYGQIYPKQSIAVALLRLAQSGRLRRFKSEGGEFVYTASTNLTSEQSGRIAQINK
jgi:hypothetical protein